MRVVIYPSAVQGTATAPPSKSYAQRAIAAAMLACGTSHLTNVGVCDDTKAVLNAVQELGATVLESNGLTTICSGNAPRGTVLDNDEESSIPACKETPIILLNVGESALAARMFAPIAALSGNTHTITGRGSLLTRPIGQVASTLGQLGVVVTTSEGRLPITIQGPLRGGNIVIDGSLGSQLITGLLFALPLCADDSVIEVENMQSRPYVDMTIDLLSKFGVAIQQYNTHFHIKGNQHYTPIDYSVEGDWSGASCLLVAGAVAGSVTIENLNPSSLQADRRVVEAIVDSGARVEWHGGMITVRSASLKGFSFDATHCPDLFPALAALAANCEGISTIIGTNRLRHKESDRGAALAMEFAKLGINVDLSVENTMTISGTSGRTSHGSIHVSRHESSHGSSSRKPITSEHITVASHHDHRIAMALAVVALTHSTPVIIDGAEAVSKSYPEFWTTFRTLQNLK